MIRQHVRAFTLIELLICTAIIMVIAYTMTHWMRPIESTSAGLERRFDLSAENARLARQLGADSIAARLVRVEDGLLTFETPDGVVHYVLQEGQILRRTSDETAPVASQVEGFVLAPAGRAVRVRATFSEDRGPRKVSLKTNHLAGPRWIGREMTR